ncbi:small GTPase superfamily, Rab type, partial [Kipferlia bialata]|eukprot:g2530.t1
MYSSEKPSISHKVVFLGETGTGKTSIVKRYVHNSFSPYHEISLGAAFLKKQIELEDCLMTFLIWDTAGQERFRALTPSYYRGAQAAVVVYDIQSTESFAK